MSAQTVAIPEAPVAAEELVQGALSSQALDIRRPSSIGLPTRDEWIMLSGIANTLANSEILPDGLKGKPQNVLAVVLKGRDLGLTPTQAVWGIHMIEGMPSLAAHTMMALIRKEGHRIGYTETNENIATIVAQRFEGRNPKTGEREFGPEVRVSWTIDQAVQAGLLRPGTGADQGKLVARSRTGKVLPWELFTEAMLRARAASAMARMEFSDVLLGSFYTPEELGAEVDGQGNVVRYPTGPEASRSFDAGIQQRKDEVAGRQQQPGDAPLEPDQATSANPPEGALKEGAALAGDPPATVIDVPTEPAPLDRIELLVELDEHARVLSGGSVSRYTARGVAAYRANAKDWTAEQLEEFLAERRATYDAHMSTHPEDALPVDGEVLDLEASDEGDSDGGAEVDAEDAVIVEDPPEVPFGEPAETNSLTSGETKEQGDTLL